MDKRRNFLSSIAFFNDISLINHSFTPYTWLWQRNKQWILDDNLIARAPGFNVLGILFFFKKKSDPGNAIEWSISSHQERLVNCLTVGVIMYPKFAINCHKNCNTVSL